MNRTKTATLITPDGTMIAIAPTNGSNFTLEEVQKHVGGYVELLALSNNQIMLLNEEGKALRLNPNSTATNTAHIERVISVFDSIVGPVIVCHKSMFR